MREKVALSRCFFSWLLFQCFHLANGRGEEDWVDALTDYSNITDLDYNYDGISLSSVSSWTTEEPTGSASKDDDDILVPFLESSTQFVFGDDDYTRISLEQSFKFLGTSYDSAFINGNGIITFGAGSSAFRYQCRKADVTTPTISAFMTDAHNFKGDGRSTAKLLYRQDTSRSSLDKVAVDVRKAFPSQNDTLPLNWMLIVTWYNIPPNHDTRHNFRNTFQAVLTTDGVHSYVLMYYKNITWPVPAPGEATTAEVGIYGGKNNAQNSFIVHGSCTRSILQITSMSNIDSPGKFVFQVDQNVTLSSTPPGNASNLLPFQESDGSTRFLYGDDSYQQISLDRQFSFLGTRYSSVYINGNGVITFGSGSGAYDYSCNIREVNFPSISVFMADSKNTVGDGLATAKLLYRQDVSRSSLDRVSEDVFKAFPTLNGSVTLNWMLIVTWYNIPSSVESLYYLRNTFQAVLTGDGGENSFVLLTYNRITWPLPSLSTAEAGIYGGRLNHQKSFVIPGSCSGALLNITTMSNIDIPGKFVFKVDQDVEVPEVEANKFKSDVELFPFLESSGSQRFYFGDDEHTSIALQHSFNFLGTSYPTAYINGNGIITFGEGRGHYDYNCNKTTAPVPTISVFMDDSHNDRGDGAETAKLLYRQDTSRSSLEKVSRDVFTAFPTLNETVTLNWMLIVTWYNIPPRENGQHRSRNTFQAVLTSDGEYSFVLFYYKQITWPVVGNTAEAGIYGGRNNSGSSYVIPESCSSSLINITKMSNIGSPGKFVFRVDSGVEPPTHSPGPHIPPRPFGSLSSLNSTLNVTAYKIRLLAEALGINVTDIDPILLSRILELEGDLPTHGFGYPRTTDRSQVHSSFTTDTSLRAIEQDLELLPHLEYTGSRRFYFRDDETTTVSLQQKFDFLGTRYSTAIISGNGAISFGSEPDRIRYNCNNSMSSIPIIGAYLADADNRRGDAPTTAKLLYRQDTSRTSLDRVSRDVFTAFPNLRGAVALNWTLVVTWSNIPPHENDGQVHLRNTFQAVLTSDGTHSFVLFYYKNITWPVKYDKTAEAGIYGGRYNVQHSYVIPGSCNRSLINITKMSNIGSPGKFVFRVDGGITLPGANISESSVVNNTTEGEPTNVTFAFENDFELIPFLGSSGSERFYFSDDDHTSISLQRVFNFLGTNYSVAYINGNGILNFGRGLGSFNYDCDKTAPEEPTISVHMEDGDNRRGAGGGSANLLYRQDTSGRSLNEVTKIVLTGFPELSDRLNLTWMLLVTWENIAPHANAGQPHLRNTYQAVLTTDGTYSFVVLIYKSITWPVNERTAEAGIYGGPLNLQNSYVIPGSCTHSLLNITSMSNIGAPGKFVFRVDNELRLPARSPCVPHIQLPTQIGFRPAVSPAIGGDPLITHDLRLCPTSNVSAVTCTFHDPSRKKPVKVAGFMLPGQLAAVCPKPEFYSLGRMRVDLALNFTSGQTTTAYGFINVIKPVHNTISLKLLATKEGTGDDGGIFLEASWERSSGIYSRALGRTLSVVNASLTLMELRGQRWQALHVFQNVTFRPTAYRSMTTWRGELPEHLESLALSDKLESPPRILKLSATILLKYQPAFNIEQVTEIPETTWQLAKLKVAGVSGANIFDRKCKQWYDQEPTPPTDNLPCPFVEKQATADGRFWRQPIILGTLLNPLNFSVYIQTNPSPSGAGSYCTYDAKGNLVIGYPYGSRVHRSSPNKRKDPWSHYWEDVIPYLQCCQLSFFKNENCVKYFFVKRLPQTGLGYESPSLFRVTGTGHVFSLDGATYQVSGTGRVSLFKYPQQLEVQVILNQIRFNSTIYDTTNTTTGITTAVMTSYGANGTVTKLQVSARETGGLLVWMNGEPLNFYEDKQFNHYHVISEYPDIVHQDTATISVRGSYELQLRHSNEIYVMVRAGSVSNVKETLLEISGAVGTDLRGKIAGLVGNYDGDASNDTSTLARGQWCVPPSEVQELVTSTVTWNSSEHCAIQHQLTDSHPQITYADRQFQMLLNASRTVAVPRSCGQPPTILNGGYWTIGEESSVGTSIQPYCNEGLSLNASRMSGESTFQLRFTCLPDPHLPGESRNITRGATWISEGSSQPLSSYILECIPSFSSRVKVSPAVVSILGSTPMTVTVPHALDKEQTVSKVTCSFSSAMQSSHLITDGEITQVLPDKSEISCPVPVFHSLGKARLRIKVDYRQSPSLYFEHHFWVVKIAEDGQKQLTILSSPNSIDLSWNTGNFNVTNRQSGSCELSVALMQKRNNALKETDPLWYPVCNSGQYKVSRSNWKSFKKEEIPTVFTQPTIVVLKSTQARDSEFGVASDLLSGIAMLHDNLVKGEESGSSFDLLCKQWYEHDKKHPLTDDTLPCPRSVKQAQVDWRFSPATDLLNPGAVSVFVQSTPSISKSGSQCAYNEAGALMYGPPGGSRVSRFSSNSWDRYWGHYTHDTLPYLYCCKWGSDVDTHCNKYFYTRRGMPVGGKLGLYSPPKFAHAWGTARMQTFGGDKFRVGGEGDFWMVKYEDRKWHDLEQFQCQGKLEPYVFPSRKKMAVIKSVVMEQIVQGTKVTVRVTRSTTSSRGSRGFDILVDGDLVESKELKTIYHEGMTMFLGTTARIVFQVGFSVRFSAALGEPGLNVIFSAGSELVPKVDGLLKGFGGESKAEFGTRMRVAKNESIFLAYPVTQEPGIMPVEIEMEPAAPGSLADPNVFRFCGNSTDCLFDLKATGDESFARTGKYSSEYLQGLIEASGTTLIECAPPENLRGDQVVVSSLVPGSKMTIFCNDGRKMDFTCRKIENSVKWISGNGERFEKLVKSCLLYSESLHQTDMGSGTSVVLITILFILVICVAVVGYVFARRKFMNGSFGANPDSVSVLYSPKSDADLQDVGESVKLINL